MWHAIGHGVLAAQAVLQQDQLGVPGQARRQLRHRLFGVVSLAGHQQTVDRRVVVGQLRRNRLQLRLALFDQGQAACGFIGL
ncbi:hypothetical protein D3C84_948590 [compost metagenome]